MFGMEGRRNYDVVDSVRAMVKEELSEKVV